MTSGSAPGYQSYLPSNGQGGIGQPEYSTAAKVGAVVLTIFAPLIALIAAIVLRTSEVNQARRAMLRTWTIASVSWLAVQFLIVIVGIGGVAGSAPQVSHSGPCVGGPIPGAPGTPVGHGNYRFNCANGGSTVVHLG
ncbi:MAG: hypothetical protein M0030_31710 [Actinomycetota bacterium]|jgi:hypothetical protein|nr:hypothetical protein [Actinomycetota bacterium]